MCSSLKCNQNVMRAASVRIRALMLTLIISVVPISEDRNVSAKLKNSKKFAKVWFENFTILINHSPLCYGFLLSIYRYILITSTNQNPDFCIKIKIKNWSLVHFLSGGVVHSRIAAMNLSKKL